MKERLFAFCALALFAVACGDDPVTLGEFDDTDNGQALTEGTTDDPATGADDDAATDTDQQADPDTTIAGSDTATADNDAADNAVLPDSDSGPSCGDGAVTYPEQCEPGDTISCTSLSSNYAEGDAPCADCAWDTAACSMSSGGAGTADCVTVWDCIEACGADQTCGQACFDQGTAAAKQQYNALAQCGNDYCSSATSEEEYYQCLMSVCSAEYDACEQGSSNGSGGTATCKEMDQCIDGCSDQACVSACTAGGSSQELAKLTSLYDCIENSGCSDTLCIETVCCTEILACGYDHLQCS